MCDVTLTFFFFCYPDPCWLFAPVRYYRHTPPVTSGARHEARSLGSLRHVPMGAVNSDGAIVFVKLKREKADE